jgi:hypothetical protein
MNILEGNPHGAVRTNVVGGYDELHNTLTVGEGGDGLSQDERDILFTSKGM